VSGVPRSGVTEKITRRRADGRNCWPRRQGRTTSASSAPGSRGSYARRRRVERAEQSAATATHSTSN